MATLAVLTVNQLAERIASQLNLDSILEKPFPDCDFSIIDADPANKFVQEQLNNLHSRVNEWFGIKKVDTGFDSYNLCVVADYYGGGCPAFLQLESGICREEAELKLAGVITESLEYQEPMIENPLLLIEFLDIK